MKARDIPNVISLLRIGMTVPIIGLMLKREFAFAMLLFVAAGISDALDGYLAKRNGWVSRVGSFLDPLADKILLVSSYLALGWLEILPLWLVAAVIARDVVIALGAFAYHFMIGTYDMAPTRISKLNTVMQIVLVLSVVWSLGIMPLPDSLIAALVYTVLATTILSGIDYVWTWGAKAIAARPRNQ